MECFSFGLKSVRSVLGFWALETELGGGDDLCIVQPLAKTTCWTFRPDLVYEDDCVDPLGKYEGSR